MSDALQSEAEQRQRAAAVACMQRLPEGMAAVTAPPSGTACHVCGEEDEADDNVMLQVPAVLVLVTHVSGSCSTLLLQCDEEVAARCRPPQPLCCRYLSFHSEARISCNRLCATSSSHKIHVIWHLVVRSAMGAECWSIRHAMALPHRPTAACGCVTAAS